MSKQTSVLNLEHVEDFICQVGHNNGWLNFNELPFCVFHSPDGFNFQAKMASQSVKRIVYIKMGVKLNHKLNIYLLSSFGTEGQNTMPGYKVLYHHNKDFAKIRDKQSDFETGNVSKFWTIRSARDIESLMNEYDRLARIWRCPTIFNLPS